MDKSNLQAIISDSRFYTDEIEKRLIESGGEITKELEDVISYRDYNLKELEANVDITALALDRVDLLIEYYNQQIEALRGILDGLNKVETRLKNNLESALTANNLESALTANNLTQVSGDLKTITLRRNPPRVDIFNEDVIPEDYKKIVVSTGINKMQISDDLKAGKEITGCRLVQGTSIKIGQAKPKIEGRK